MDRIDEYHRIVHDFLQEFITYDVQAQLIFDPVRDRYLVMHSLTRAWTY